MTDFDLVAEVSKLIRQIPDPDKAAAAIVSVVRAHPPDGARRSRRKPPKYPTPEETDEYLDQQRESAARGASTWPRK